MDLAGSKQFCEGIVWKLSRVKMGVKIFNKLDLDVFFVEEK